MNRVLYLDYAATTPIDSRVAQKMQQYLTYEGVFGNPASQHIFGEAALSAVNHAREQVANFLHAEPSEIIWTSGATESNNLALKGAAQLYQRKGKHIVTLKTEHKAVLDTCMHLEKQGYRVTYLNPQASGLVDLDEFENALRADTILVSIMHVNNETGVVQDLKSIANITSMRGILLHVDAAQSPGKCALDVSELPIDMISLCAHKVYGPKGIGALYLRKKPRVRVTPLLHGGGHENGMRSGTLPVHQIVGMGEAFELASESAQHIPELSALFHSGLNAISALRNKLVLNGDTIKRVPHILNIRFCGMIADAVLKQLPMIAASTASACQGKGTEGSYVLRAMGLSEEQAKSSVRFSFGKYTTRDEIETALQYIEKVLS